MTAALKACASCGNGFRGSARAVYCSAACRQRARRERGRRDCDTDRDRAVTVIEGGHPAHTDQARAVLDTLDAELKSNGAQLGVSLKFSAAERAVLGLIADAIDRRVDLQRLYDASDDPAVRVRLSAELRLLEQAAARLLNGIRTEPPAPKSLRSLKASRAVRSRWDRGA